MDGELSWIHSDHLHLSACGHAQAGSATLLTDADGNEVRRLAYRAFGEEAENIGSGTEPTYSYTGKERDSSGLMYYGARYYDPELSRFITPDSIYDTGTQGLNRYSYVKNNPINYHDPTGRIGMPPAVDDDYNWTYYDAPAGEEAYWNKPTNPDDWGSELVRDDSTILGRFYRDVVGDIAGTLSGADENPMTGEPLSYYDKAGTFIELETSVLLPGVMRGSGLAVADDVAHAIKGLDLADPVGAAVGKGIGKIADTVGNAFSGPLETTLSSIRRGGDNWFETSIETQHGLVDIAAEVYTKGDTLVLDAFTVYGRQGDLPAGAITKEIFKAKSNLFDAVKSEGFKKLRVIAERVEKSSSAVPGHKIDKLIPLTD